MPQKNNPHSLERIKSLSVQATVCFSDVVGCQHSVFSPDLDSTFTDDALSGIGAATIRSLRLACTTIETIEINSDRIADPAGAYRSTTSHLADELVRRYDLTFRAARQIIGCFVRDSLAAGKTPSNVKADGLIEAGQEIANIKFDMSTAEVRDALNARAFLYSRASIGSVTPSETEPLAKGLQNTLKKRWRWYEGAQTKVENSLNDLLGYAHLIATNTVGITTYD